MYIFFKNIVLLSFPNNKVYIDNFFIEINKQLSIYFVIQIFVNNTIQCDTNFYQFIQSFIMYQIENKLFLENDEKF